MNGPQDPESVMRSEAAHPRRLPWILSVAARVWSRLLRTRQAKRARAALHGLDDRMLKDIGVSRCEIAWVAEHGKPRAGRTRAAASSRQQPAPAQLAMGRSTEDADAASAPIDLASVRARLCRASAKGIANDTASASSSARDFARLHHFLL